jgi:transcriptional regulator with XRE-family HTH domain
VQDEWKYKAYPKTQCEKLAKRLKAEWLSYKEKEKVTQTEFASRLGVTQSAFNQFISGACPINNEMILMLCHQLGVEPKTMVKGLSFFEPFFRDIVSPRVITVRLKLKNKGVVTKPKTGAKLMVYGDFKSSTDVYAVEIDTDEYNPRYRPTEKLVVIAEEPAIGEEAYVVLKDGKQCATTMYHDHFECSKSVKCIGCADLTGPDDERISHIHKVVGMSK